MQGAVLCGASRAQYIFLPRPISWLRSQAAVKAQMVMMSGPEQLLMSLLYLVGVSSAKDFGNLSLLQLQTDGWEFPCVHLQSSVFSTFSGEPSLSSCNPMHRQGADYHLINIARSALSTIGISPEDIQREKCTLVACLEVDLCRLVRSPVPDS